MATAMARTGITGSLLYMGLDITGGIQLENGHNHFDKLSHTKFKNSTWIPCKVVDLDDSIRTGLDLLKRTILQDGYLINQKCYYSCFDKIVGVKIDGYIYKTFKRSYTKTKES